MPFELYFVLMNVGIRVKIDFYNNIYQRSDTMKDFWADQLKDFSSPILQENEVMEAQENPHAIMVAEASHAYPSKSNSSGISSISIFILPFLISIPLLFASIGHDSNEPDCLGTGEVTYHSADYCQERFFGDFRGMVGNQTIDGADYTIYEWEIGTINSWRFVDDFWSEEEWVSSAIYARLDFTTSPFRSGGYYTYFECDGIFNCATDKQFDNKDWITVNAKQMDHSHGESTNTTTIFVNIEQGMPLLIAIDSDVELREPDLNLELVH